MATIGGAAKCRFADVCIVFIRVVHHAGCQECCLIGRRSLVQGRKRKICALQWYMKAKFLGIEHQS